MSELENLALDTFIKGSKSFSLAAKFFPKEMMISSSLIYLWCRHCDDVIDVAEASQESLNLLVHQTQSVWQSPQEVSEAPFKALLQVKSLAHLPEVYPMELLKGMEMDLKGTLYETLSDLKLYCYRVASTVGLMMCHVMGLFSVSALKEASELGMAMQLTNIARDVKTDYELGRLYLPLEFLYEVGLNQENFFLPENRSNLFKAIAKLVNESERLYQSGLRGTKDLPFVSALTILIAGKVYRQIGRDLLKTGISGIEQRIIVGRWMKLFLILSSFIEISAQIPARILNRRKKVIINETWIYA